MTVQTNPKPDKIVDVLSENVHVQQKKRKFAMSQIKGHCEDGITNKLWDQLDTESKQPIVQNLIKYK